MDISYGTITTKKRRRRKQDQYHDHDQQQKHPNLSPSWKNSTLSNQNVVGFHPKTRCFFLVVLSFIGFFHRPVSATIPDVIVTIEPNGPIDTADDDGSRIEPILAKRAAFGGRYDITGQLVHAPAYDRFLCEWYNTTRFNDNNNSSSPNDEPPLPEYTIPLHDTVMLAARGTFLFFNFVKLLT